MKNRRFRQIRFHDLRPSCATLMRHKGVKIAHIQKWLGHSPLSTPKKMYAL
ncbi:MAG: tyrosine-type recombinase/integrase [Clostridia bacterium]|nr:tyrosine-type recombinase/integrase [Clostridia bacterium]